MGTQGTKNKQRGTKKKVMQNYLIPIQWADHAAACVANPNVEKNALQFVCISTVSKYFIYAAVRSHDVEVYFKRVLEQFSLLIYQLK